MVESIGPVSIVSVKTMIGFQTCMTFADLILGKRTVRGWVVLACRLESTRFTKIETISHRNHIHCFRFASVEELNAEVLGWLREAYEVGMQMHLLGK